MVVVLKEGDIYRNRMKLLELLRRGRNIRRSLTFVQLKEGLHALGAVLAPFGLVSVAMTGLSSHAINKILVNVSPMATPEAPPGDVHASA